MPILTYAPLPPHRSWLLLTAIIFTTAVAPLLGFAYGGIAALFMLSRGASGMALMPFALHPASAWPMYLLAAWAAAAAISFVCRPDLAPFRPWVRHGIFTGLALNVLYAAIFVGMLTLAFGGNGRPSGPILVVFLLAFLLAIQVVLMIVISKGTELANVLPRLGYACLGPAIPVLLIAAVIDTNYLMAGGFFLLAPGLPLFSFAILAPLLWRETPKCSPKTTLRTGLAWVGGTGTSLVCAVLTYPTLRTGGPCYVATAASKGHPRWVGPRDTCGMTRQLRTAICAEIALHQFCPPARRIFRALYDRVGPILVVHITTPLRADVAHAIFKPIEAIAWLLLRSQVRSPAKLAGLLGRRSWGEQPGHNRTAHLS